jgi:hypothetical protein
MISLLFCIRQQNTARYRVAVFDLHQFRVWSRLKIAIRKEMGRQEERAGDEEFGWRGLGLRSKCGVTNAPKARYAPRGGQ